MRKKLRYQYMNNMSRKYNDLKTKSGLPTPISSENDTGNDTDVDCEESIRARKRVTRRWKSIIGEVTSTDEDELESMEANGEEEEEDADEEKKFFNNHHKPQESYETWEINVNKRKPIERKMISYKKYKKAQKYCQRKMEIPMIHVSKRIRHNMEMIFEGYESVSDDLDDESSVGNFAKGHIKTLTELLYNNVFKKNWEIAYKCFTLLVRVPSVDIKRIWHVGTLILQNLDEEKSLEFLKWMSSVYSSRSSTFVQNVNYRKDPVFSSGSKEHTPKYTITWLWGEILNKSENDEDLENIIDRILEMVLIPPYMETNELWYMLAVCYLIKASTLSNKAASLDDNGTISSSHKDILNNGIIQCINNTKKYLAKSTVNNLFQYPKRQIASKLKNIESRLYT